MVEFLKNYSKELLIRENLKSHRNIGIIKDYNEFSIDIIRNLNIINIDTYTYDIVKKINTEGFSMKWHIDNAKIIRHKKNFVDNKNIVNQITLSSKYALHYHLRKPTFTLIVYESDYDKHFTGGTLEFIDNTIVYPQKGLYVFFDSREIHKVNKILSGTRINYLIKFYPKDI